MIRDTLATYQRGTATKAGPWVEVRRLNVPEAPSGRLLQEEMLITAGQSLRTFAVRWPNRGITIYLVTGSVPRSAGGGSILEVVELHRGL